jgi:ribulose-5-phosphate 4-epimerase/fuculose-1-phosphate aldolase
MMNELSIELCQAARLLFRHGLSVGIAGHLSIKIAPDRMIANRFGPSFGTLKPADILTLDLDGNVQEGQGVVNDTIRLHGVIHRLNPDTTALAHTHPPATITFSTLRTIPEIFDQETCFLAGEMGIVEEDYSGLASKEERVRPMAEALRKHRVVILPNHGAITAGQTVQQVAFSMILLEMAAQRNISVAIAAQAIGATSRPISSQVALATKKELASLNALPLIWQDQMARLRVTDPDLF